MKKKTLLILILSIGLLCLVGCGKEKKESAFKVEFKGADITPGATFDSKNIEADYNYSEVPDCAFGGKGIIYTYEDIEISMKEDKTIYSVYFVTPEVKTKEGLSISDEVAKVKKLYGEPDKNENNQMVYRRGNIELTININNDYVGGIEYLLVEE